MSGPANSIIEAEDVISEARHLNSAIWMAAAGLGDPDHRNAIQSVADIIEKRLIKARDMLDAVRELIQ